MIQKSNPDDMIEGVFIFMKLTKQLERLCEKQYRKGFQQGFLASQQKLMTERQVDIYRANGEKECYSKAISPTTKQKIKKKNILLSEINMPKMDELKLFLYENYSK